MAKRLLEAGADLNEPAAKVRGRIALEGAAESSRLDMVQLLLNAGTDIGGECAKRVKDLAEENCHWTLANVYNVRNHNCVEIVKWAFLSGG